MMLKPVNVAEFLGKPIERLTQAEAMRRPIYGVWTCAGGRQILFTRSYRPVFERPSPDAPAVAAEPGEWVENIEGEEFFYDDWSAPKRRPETIKKLRAVLAAWGVTEYPASLIGR
jgi:hypothetical protein